MMIISTTLLLLLPKCFKAEHNTAQLSVYLLYISLVCVSILLYYLLLNDGQRIKGSEEEEEEE